MEGEIEKLPNSNPNWRPWKKLPEPPDPEEIEKLDNALKLILEKLIAENQALRKATRRAGDAPSFLVPGSVRPKAGNYRGPRHSIPRPRRGR